MQGTVPGLWWPRQIGSGRGGEVVVVEDDLEKRRQKRAEE